MLDHYAFAGLYINALFFDYSFNAAPANTHLRNELANVPVDVLQDMIRQKNIEMPANSKNPRHLIRALERGGNSDTNNIPRRNSIIIGINPGREVLAERIAKRVETIFEQGFLNEVEQLVSVYGYPNPMLDAIAYKIALQHQTLAEHDIRSDEKEIANLKQAISMAELRYAKRQLTWFKRYPHINWFEDTPTAEDYLNNQTRIKPL